MSGKTSNTSLKKNDVFIIVWKNDLFYLKVYMELGAELLAKTVQKVWKSCLETLKQQ